MEGRVKEARRRAGAAGGQDKRCGMASGGVEKAGEQAVGSERSRGKDEEVRVVGGKLGARERVRGESKQREGAWKGERNLDAGARVTLVVC